MTIVQGNFLKEYPKLNQQRLCVPFLVSESDEVFGEVAAHPHNSLSSEPTKLDNQDSFVYIFLQR